MIETYRLDGNALPSLPCPHDRVINSVVYDDSHIVFRFEEGLSEYDSLPETPDGYDSLIIRYHLCDPEFFTYSRIRHLTKLGQKYGKSGYYLVENDKLDEFAKNKLVFLFQNISYTSVDIRLFTWKHRDIIIDASVDYIEYEWIEKTTDP